MPHLDRARRRSPVVLLLVLGLSSVDVLAESPLGVWEVTYLVGDREVSATLTITEDGRRFAGSWESERNTSTISDVRFEREQLSFVRTLTRGDREIRLPFEGTIVADQLTGAFTSARGRFTVRGKRAEPPAPEPSRERPQRERRDRMLPTHRDAPYGPHERNVLDFWKAESKTPAPLLLYIHGGGFRSGSKESADDGVIKSMLDAGISVAAINYRFAATAPLPAAHHDSRRALQFLRSKAKEWNIDTTRVGAFGASAGAQLCMFLAFHDEMARPNSVDPVERESTRLSCVATYGGQTTMDLEWWRRWIPGYDVEHRGYDEHFGVSSRADAMKVIRDTSALSLISGDDPPILMGYGMDPGAPIPDDPDRAHGWKVHHVIFGLKLKEKMDALGIEADLMYPGTRTTYTSYSQFFIAKLRGE